MTKSCIECNSEFETKDSRKKFCGHSCSAKSSNRGRKRPANCKHCSVDIDYWLTYCSNSCSIKFREAEKLRLWLAGSWNPEGVRDIPRCIRNYLTEQQQSSCSKCAWSVVNLHTGKVPLQINHIDGRASNNTKENLELICPNCHSLTENFGARNKGSDRTYRYDFSPD